MGKVIQAGPVALEVGVVNGEVKLSASLDASLGGGEAAGVLKAKASMEVDLEAAQCADLGLALIEAKFPGLAGAVGMLKSFVDAELAKLSV